MPAEATLQRAQEILLQKGPADALQFLGASPDAGAEPVLRTMHALLWTHRETLPQWLQEAPFLDPVWSHCTVCDSVWLSSPAGWMATGQTCECGRVLCVECATASGPRCPQGHTYRPAQKPNGRRRREAKPSEERERIDWFEPPPERPVESDPDLHLDFGTSGRIPIGTDPSFPMTPTGSAADHLGWVETLLDAGLVTHARQQLALVQDRQSGQSDRARALWLRARLQWVRLRHSRARHAQHRDVSLRRPSWTGWERGIAQWLDEATRLAPEDGAIRLTAAQFALDANGNAIEDAEQAHRLLPDEPAARLAYGRALRAAARAAEAVHVLRDPPGAFDDLATWRRELSLAELEQRCAAEPLDVDAHLQLGRWCFRHDRRDRAKQLFEKLVELRPDRPEGYCGLGRLAYVDFDLGTRERVERGYALCRKALARKPDLGLAHELLGSIFRGAQAMHVDASFEIGSPLEAFRRALDLDDTCDEALQALAEDLLDRGKMDAARQLLERAAEIDSNLDGVYFKLAIIYGARREYEKQERAYARAKELAPLLEISDDYKARVLRLAGFEY